MLRAIVQPAALTACLFAGPILQSCLSVRHAASYGSHHYLQTLRNLIVAPLTEEFCFRACMAPLFLLEVRSCLLQGTSVPFEVLLLPLACLQISQIQATMATKPLSSLHSAQSQKIESAMSQKLGVHMLLPGSDDV